MPFWFVREEEEIIFEGKGWPDLLNSWLKLVPASGRFKAVEGQVVVLEDMTARDYVESDPLDLDHLSTSAKARPASRHRRSRNIGYVSTCGAVKVTRL